MLRDRCGYNFRKDIFSLPEQLLAAICHEGVERDPERTAERSCSGTDAHDQISGIVTCPRLLKDMKHLSGKAQTYDVETFHAYLIHFAPKCTAFSYGALAARSYIAALHFNENSQRSQRRTAAGSLLWKRKHPKARGYVSSLLVAVIDSMERLVPNVVMGSSPLPLSKS
ncbi:hypothetical protein V5799_021345 [Amblyomma americanum]|uniref:Uncharacterized protein n=1 Tax=Amblyomma americanum TaxID=6943 RepID=A0AAQ4FNG8_AMBAM